MQDDILQNGSGTLHNQVINLQRLPYLLAPSPTTIRPGSTTTSPSCYVTSHHLKSFHPATPKTHQRIKNVQQQRTDNTPRRDPILELRCANTWCERKLHQRALRDRSPSGYQRVCFQAFTRQYIRDPRTSSYYYQHRCCQSSFSTEPRDHRIPADADRSPKPSTCWDEFSMGTA